MKTKTKLSTILKPRRAISIQKSSFEYESQQMKKNSPTANQSFDDNSEPLNQTQLPSIKKGTKPAMKVINLLNGLGDQQQKKAKKNRFNLNIKMQEDEIDLKIKSNNKFQLQLFINNNNESNKNSNNNNTRSINDNEETETQQMQPLRAMTPIKIRSIVANKIQLDSFIQIDQVLKQIIKNIKQNSNGDLVASINEYLNLTINGDFSSLEILFSDEKQKKLMRQAITLERIGIAVLVNSFFDLHFFLQNLPNFKNVLIYIQQNYNLLSDMIVEKLKSIDDSEVKKAIQGLMLLQTEKKVTNSRNLTPIKHVQSDSFITLKQNNEMLANLYKQLTKNTRDLYSFLLNFMRVCSTVSLEQAFKGLLDFVSLYFTMQQSYQGIVGVPLLCVAPTPYLSPIQNYTYTLFLDMDETLVHFTETPSGGQFLVRPYAQQFLKEMSQYYELIVFTAGLPDYANWVLDTVDTDRLIKHRLYRQHAIQQKNIFIKDLSRVGRDINKSIIIDNVAENFQNQPENGIFIKSWYSDQNDTALAELCPLLKQIVVKQYDDVRVALQNLKEQMMQNIQQGIQFPHLNLQLQ